MGWMARGILVKFSQKANKVFKIPKENGMTTRACVAAIVGFVVGFVQTAKAATVFETANDHTGVYTFGSPVESGETGKANIGSAAAYEAGRFAFRSGTVNIKEGGYVHMMGYEAIPNTGKDNQTHWGNWLGANGCSAPNGEVHEG